MNIKVCDVCGNEMPKRKIVVFKRGDIEYIQYRYTIKGFIYDDFNGERSQKIDVCHSCFDAMRKILNKEREEQVQKYLKPYGY